ncbi:MAG: hypothetical protein JO130_10100 [Solirubrobacterales bacterium]|nr:hypothetical protein [Solirubrobacterales bacterium]
MASAPEITTFCPAWEGSGEDEIVSPLGLHVGVQQPDDGQHVPVQHVVLELVQHVGVPFVQHEGLDTGQHTGCAPDASAADPGGTGQHGTKCARSCGQIMCGDSAPAAPAAAKIEIAAATAARRRSVWTIERRIASYGRERDRR